MSTLILAASLSRMLPISGVLHGKGSISKADVFGVLQLGLPRVSSQNESHAVDALRLPFYSSMHPRGSPSPGNSIEPGNSVLD